MSLSRPELASRPCSLCRKYQFDEKTGEPVMGRDGNYMLRRGETLCESSTGCLKGHWKDSPDLSPMMRQYLDFFWSVRLAGFHALPEEMQKNRWFSVLFGQLSRIITMQEIGRQKGLNDVIKQVVFLR